jgi:NTP pyrophosphatase (non-canonical NTP hydrolase)
MRRATKVGDLEEILNGFLEFRDERDWAKYHNPKDLAISLVTEAAELIELYRFRKPEEARPEDVREELADILGCVVLIAKHYEIDLKEAVKDKLKKNRERYPVDKCSGSNKKYTEF